MKPQSRNNYLRNLNRLRGFTDGAGAKAMNIAYNGDKDYELGYMDGQKTKRAYADRTAKEFGFVFSEIVPMNTKAMRKIYCEQCWNPKPTHPDDAALGLVARRTHGKTKASLTCDSCGKLILTGEMAVAESIPATMRDWESGYLASLI